MEQRGQPVYQLQETLCPRESQIMKDTFILLVDDEVQFVEAMTKRLNT